jgi:WD40 repeat protein
VRSFASQDLSSGVAGAAFEGRGYRVIASDNVAQAVKIWDAGLQGDAEQANLPGDPAGFNPLAFTAASQLAISRGDGSVEISDVSTSAPYRVSSIAPDESGNAVFALEESPDRRTLAILRLGTTAVVDSQSGTTIWRMEEPLYAVGWSEDGQQLAGLIPQSAEVHVFDATGTLLRTSEGTPGFFGAGVDVRNDGLLAVVEVPQGRPDLAAHKVTLRDPTSSEKTRTLPATGAVGPLQFDPTGKRFALAFIDGRVEIWNVDDDGKVVLTGDIGNVHDLAFSPDGSRIATAGDDGTVRIWDSSSGVPILVLRGHTAAVDSIAFSPDGAELASAGGDEVTRVWSLRLEDLIEIGLRNVTRQLTDQECREYLHVEACPSPAP